MGRLPNSDSVVIALSVVLVAACAAQPAGPQTEAAPPEGSVLLLEVHPSRAVIQPNDTVLFDVEIEVSEDVETIPDLEWSVTSGTISDDGMFVAGRGTGKIDVTVKPKGRKKKARAEVLVVEDEPQPESVEIVPGSASMHPGDTVIFDAMVLDDQGFEIDAAIEWSATGGDMGPRGRYTAGMTTGQHSVTARGPDGLSATAAVQILEEEPVASTVTVSPGTANLTSGDVYAFAAIILDQRGEPMSLVPTWTALGGTISSGGEYTAGTAEGTFPVAAAVSAALADTAWVTIASTPPPDPQDPQPLGPSGSWSLILAEEFDGSSLNGGVWTPNFAWWPDPINNELGFYDPDYVEVSDGHLRLNADEVSRSGMPYSTSAISSHGKFAFRYGTVEMRAKFPAGNGFHVAFWTVLEGGPWPPEIDIVEHLGEDVTLLFHTLHYTDNGHQVDYSWWRGTDFTAGFHTYTMTWKPDRIEWYVDGILRHTVSQRQIIPQEDMYLLANLAVGGNWPLPPDASTEFPASWDIDYIRVWQE